MLGGWGGTPIIGRVVTEGFSEEVPFEQKPERDEEVRHRNV